MERSVRLENWLRNLRPQLDKFKYPALVLLIGLLLLLIPGCMGVFRRIMRQRYFAAHYKAVMARK